MTAIKLTTIGNSTGAVIPKEILEKLHVNKGDTLYLVEDEDGYRLTPYNEEFLEQMKVAEIIMREDRDVLKALAK
ncbi:MAG: AbrB/MazE/SpoVT family DNA-binding domain-containing protein [Campylobacterota bacterium]|nr:AbrB/MazE/SpoVT family DNA-binding domain-containing protein [Campylobacterota bacterium]